jgi:RHS repeat-associated protein
MDQLGSVVNSSQAYFPWGETKGTSNPQDTWNFAIYWQDSNTGLDYANNRYYSNAYGRFMTPDPYTNSGRLTDPQSWNRYAYTRGDPVNRKDPAGTCDQSGDSDYSVTVCEDDSDPAQIAVMMITGAGNAGQFVQDEINAALTYVNSLWPGDVLNLSKAESFISTDTAMANLPNCEKDLAAINKTAGTNITFQDISNMAASVDIENALTSGPLPPGSMGPNSQGRMQPAYMYFASGQYALTIGNTNLEYWMPGSTSWMMPDGNGGFAPMTSNRLDGMLMHELFHNLGPTDTQLQNALGLANTPITDNISQQLTKDCFPGQ